MGSKVEQFMRIKLKLKIINEPKSSVGTSSGKKSSLFPENQNGDDKDCFRIILKRSAYKLPIINMFLTKKSGPQANKPKATTKNKPLAGWQDDQESSANKYTKQPQQQIQLRQANLLQQHAQNTVLVQEMKKLATSNLKEQPKQTFIYYDWDILNSRTDMDCQKKLVEEIVQAGGIRIKPNEHQLSDFLKEARGLDINNVGSLLLSKLEVNYPFQVKAKALYTIEHLVKKNQQYFDYFKSQAEKIKEFPQPEDNVENYRKIQKAVLNLIGTSAHAGPTGVEEKKSTFVDPGYYQEPPKSELSTFIQSNANKVKKSQGKRQIIGPGQAKVKMQQKKETGPNENIDLLLKSQSISYKNETPQLQKNEGFGNLLELDSLGNNSKEAQENNDLLI